MNNPPKDVFVDDITDIEEAKKLLRWYKSAYLEFQHSYNVTCERSDELKNALELIIKKSKVLQDNPNCKDISEIARIALNK